MLRKLHSWVALVAALLLIVVALSGAVLSVFPALERARVSAAQAPDLATLASRVAASVPGVETLVRQASGTLVAYHLDGQTQRASIIDPVQGTVLGPYRPAVVQRWVRNLHRKLLLEDTGQILSALLVTCMLLVLVSGLLMLVRRMGGWRQLLWPVRGDVPQRLHNQVARVVLPGLLLSTLTGLWMSLVTLGMLPEGGATEPFAEARTDVRATLDPARMPALQGLQVHELRQLKFAAADDTADVIEVETRSGSGAIDPGSGQWLHFVPLDGWQQWLALLRMLHTGEGLWWLGLVLGACSLSVPLLAVTGALIWWRRWRLAPRVRHNAPLAEADTVLLVGSETRTTWGFALALHQALTQAGYRVHAAAMDTLGPGCLRARRLLVLTATHGDGQAPDGARQFLRRLERLPAAAGPAFAVLGFGDRQYPQFCGYAHAVHDALAARGWPALCEFGTVDRQSEPEFQAWCEGLSRALGVKLTVHYTPLLPRLTALTLASRTDYGSEPDALTVVLRFRLPRQARGWFRWTAGGLPRYEAGDLLGVVPPGGGAPRYYSLASAAEDGVLEICVRRHPDGVCSSYLTRLQPGDTIQAFIRVHEHFRPQPGREPVVLIGAGTGIGPLVGFIRHNAPARPMHLYLGARDDGNGFLYRDELHHLVAGHRLHSLTTAFSRLSPKTYVQDRLLNDSPRLRELIAQGAQVVVCGGRLMAEGVADAWDRILSGTPYSVRQLRAQGRYVEDVY